MRKDNRYVAELPSGYIKNPQVLLAGDDFDVNDVVYIIGNTVYPMFDDTKQMYGIVAANSVKGKNVLVASR